MFKTIRYLITLVWVVDVMNLEFAKCLDTIYDINGLFWFCALFFLFLESGNFWEDVNEKKD